MADRERVVPAWVTDGWYSNNTAQQQLAIARYFAPVTTPAEVSLVRLDTALHAMHLAGECKRPCYWCGEGLHPEIVKLLAELPGARHGYGCAACQAPRRVR
jgi:hypothetical protein